MRPGMITNIALVSVYCLDQDTARLYIDILGFELRTNVTMGDRFRWLIVGPSGIGKHRPPCRLADRPVRRRHSRHEPGPHRHAE